MDILHINDNTQEYIDFLLFNNFYINTVQDIMKENIVNDNVVLTNCQRYESDSDKHSESECNNDTEEELFPETIEAPININTPNYKLVIVNDDWPEEILNLKTRELNDYIKKNNLSKSQILSLKQTRRRRLNRIYSRTTRENKINKEKRINDFLNKTGFKY